MKTRKKLIKKFLLLSMTFVLVFGNSLISYAVSCKNPTVTVAGKTKTCSCGKKNEYVTINLHKGHSLKYIKVDGKEVDILPDCKYSNGKCKTCSTKIESYDLRLKKGTYKIEVKDNKGYWVTTYVTIGQKGCKHGHLMLGDWHNCGNGWYIE